MDDDRIPTRATDGSLARHPAVAAAVAGTGRWTRVEHHAEVTSTNDVALDRLRAGEPVGCVVVADAQVAGRGRAGRGWTDTVRGPEGPANLAVTATAVVADRPAGLVPLATGLAAVDALTAVGATGRLKWPNDVLLGDRKAGGILVERHDLPSGPVLLIGCGLDLDWRGVERSGEARAWTSLAEVVDRSVDRGEVLGALLCHLAERLDQLATRPAGLLQAYQEVCATLGRRVQVLLPGGEEHVGRATDLDADGHLVVTTDAGRLVVHAGDVVHLRDA
jgi:BirA family transcriptional regulator, biotin operon repressor / biotin---[acetyl-CoA-carboxylase] ligase